jgi:cation transport ATPase
VQPGTHGNLPQFALGVQFASTELEIAKKITAEHISAELNNKHERDMRRLELEGRESDSLEAERQREHERDRRLSNERKESDKRAERIFYVVVAVVSLAIGGLVYKDQFDTAVQLLKAIGAVLVLLLSGMGVERIRQDRNKRRGTKRERDD